jgi:competence protein ComEA
MNRLLNGLILIAGGILAGGLIWLVASPPRGEPVALRPAPTPTPLVVHVTGAVAVPGVYELPAGARVLDAIDAAGGLLPGADSGAMNQAARLADGDQVVVPMVLSGTNASGAEAADPAAPETPPETGLVDLNTATLEELESLPGIGPSIAQRIIDYREANGPFEKAADVVNVSGIGPATFEQIKDRITVTP